MGGLGDLVLASGLLAALKRRFAKVTLLCRQPVAGLAGLMPDAPHEVVPVAFNPYREVAPSAALDEELERLGRLETPDVLISAEFKPTWLSWYLASRLDVANSFQAQPAHAPHGLLTVLLQRRGLTSRDLASPPPSEYAHERERYAALAQWMGAPAGDTVWNKPAPANGLAPGSYVACFPGGATHIPEKNWGAERFREVLEGVNERCVVVGDEGDLEQLRTAAAAGVDIIVGTPGQIEHVAAVVAHARAWVGNDSGLAHLAQAYGVAGVVPFGGGGGWPAYGVWGSGSVGLVCELDCFGCEWACAFAEAYCLREIPVKDVLAALRQAIDHPDNTPRTWRLSFSPALAHPIVKGAAQKHREVRAQLAHRMDALIELQHGTTVPLEQALKKSQAAADSMRQTAEQRLELLNQAHRENEALRAAAADASSRFHALTAEMESMRREAHNRAQALEATAAEAASLRKEAADRLRLLESAHVEAESLRAAAEQRLNLLNEVHQEMELLRQAAAERHPATETERTGAGMETMKDPDRTP